MPKTRMMMVRWHKQLGQSGITGDIAPLPFYVSARGITVLFIIYRFESTRSSFMVLNSRFQHMVN